MSRRPTGEARHLTRVFGLLKALDCRRETVIPHLLTRNGFRYPVQSPSGEGVGPTERDTVSVSGLSLSQKSSFTLGPTSSPSGTGLLYERGSGDLVSGHEGDGEKSRRD